MVTNDFEMASKDIGINNIAKTTSATVFLFIIL